MKSHLGLVNPSMLAREHRVPQAKLDMTMQRLLEHGWTLMFYDGHCVACSRSVRFIADRSQRRRLAFCALNSDASRATLDRYGLSDCNGETLVVLGPKGTLRGTDAIVEVTRYMHGPWPILGRFLALMPNSLRGPMYRFFARNRYRIAGRSDQCWFPEGELKRRFIA